MTSQETGKDAANNASSMPSFKSGSESIDSILGGGYRAGRLTHIYGKSGSGKTQMAMQAVLEAAIGGRRSLYIDTEGSFRPERLEEMSKARGIDRNGLLNAIIYVRINSSSEQMETIRSMSSRDLTASCGLVVIDTLTRNFSVDLPGKRNLTNRQAALDVHLSEIGRDAYLARRAYLLTNRVTFGYLNEVSIGGRTVEQMVDTSIRLERRDGRIEGVVVPSGGRFSAELTSAGVN